MSAPQVYDWCSLYPLGLWKQRLQSRIRSEVLHIFCDSRDLVEENMEKGGEFLTRLSADLELYVSELGAPDLQRL